MSAGVERWHPWVPARRHPAPPPVWGPVQVLLGGGAKVYGHAKDIDWSWSGSPKRHVVAFRVCEGAPASGAGPAAEQLRPTDPWPAISEIGARLARLDRERLEELKRLRQDVDGLTEIAGSQRTVNEGLYRRLDAMERALGTLLAAKEPTAADMQPDKVWVETPPARQSLREVTESVRRETAVATLTRMGYTWKGGPLWEPPVGPNYAADA